jgi:hypothetical protein
MNHTKRGSTFVKRFCAWMGRENFLSQPLDWISRWAVNLPEPLAWSVPQGFQLPDMRGGKDPVQGPVMFLDFITRGVERAVNALEEVGSEVQRRVREAAKEAGKATPAANPCKEEKYSGMHGSPCKYNSGSDVKCPVGTISGYWWVRTTKVGEIYYVDCCGGTQTSSVWCDNSAEPNWCLGGKAAKAGRTKYTCTLALPKSQVKLDSNYELVGVDP